MEAEVLKVETLEGADAVGFYRRNGFSVTGHGTFRAEDMGIVDRDYPTVILGKEIG